MRALATEFPVKPQTNAEFVAHLIQWLRGTQYSEVLESVEQNIESDNFLAETAHGESLRIREFSDGESLTAIGFRHDYPDDEGRNWRTEAVLLRQVDKAEHSVRLRTQCQALLPGAKIVNPKKPYLVKALLSDGWGGLDGMLTVSGEPHWLEATDDHLNLASEIIQGRGSVNLPVVYISATGSRDWDLPVDQIERLAYRLGGVAHVVVEPDRAFSFDLKDVVAGRNAYGGSVGLYAPILGEAGRYFKGYELTSAGALSERVEQRAFALRTRMPVRGWDWSELQEYSLRSRRTGSGTALEFKELEALYLEEIDALKDQISDQRQTIESQNEQIADSEKALAELQDDPFVSLKSKIGELLYHHEIADRLRYAAKIALDNSDRSGMDNRTKTMLKILCHDVQRSSQLAAIVEQIKNCTETNERLSSGLIPFLESHGFNKKSEKNHIRLEPSKHLQGVSSLTMSKTPGDHKTAKNTRRQVMQILGLRSIDF